MKVDTQYILFVVLICVGITVFTRAFPFLLFGNRELPAIVRYLGKALPPAIMIILVCYFLRNINVTQWPFGLREIISCLAVVLVHIKWKNMYVSIVVGTVLYMVLTHVLV